MLVLLITLRLHAPWCASLKDKRSLVKPLLSRIREHFHASVAESGLQDSHTLAELSAALLVSDRAAGDAIAQRLYGFVQGATDAEIILWEAEYR